ERVTQVEAGENIRLQAVFDARVPMFNPEIGFEFKTADLVTVFGCKRSLAPDGEAARIESGERFRVTVEMANSLTPGSYVTRAWIVHDLSEEEAGIQFIDIARLQVVGSGWTPGVVSLPAEVAIHREEGSI